MNVEYDRRLKQLNKLHDNFAANHCQKCGNCCAERPIINFLLEDVERLAEHEGTTAEAMIELCGLKLIGREKGTRQPVYNMPAPCPFLEEEGCSVYPARGRVCREFPLKSVCMSAPPRRQVEQLVVYISRGGRVKPFPPCPGLEMAVRTLPWYGTPPHSS